ncbi:MAG: response regulator [Spirochaetes bacterium]|nr:MAG: response regulator [Spirochaetota bacterium]
MNNIGDRKFHIAIIDDDKSVNFLINRILEDEYAVSSYLSAEDALGAIELSAVDVVITDVNLPGMDGLELLRHIQEKDDNIPVILITGYTDIDTAISALKSGAFDFILKPFNTDQILISVQKALESRRLVVENRTLLKELTIKNSELEKLNLQIQTRNVEIENELDMASNLQQCIFPVTYPEIGKFRFSVKFKPVEKISGDFFDFMVYDENHFSFILADVSGHGLPAALYSAMVKMAITSVEEQNLNPAAFMDGVNRFLINAQKKMSYNYVTIFYGSFDLDTKRLRYCNAGIPAPVILKSSGDIVMLDPNGPFVGIFDTSIYMDAEVAIDTGDKILFYTDGVFECTNKDDKIMGQKILFELIKKVQQYAMSEIVTSLFGEVEKFCGENRYNDDITLVGMSYSDFP